MKRYTRCICFLMALICMLSVPVSAAEEADTRSSSYFLHFSVYLDEIDDFNFYVCFTVTGLRTMEEIGVSSIKVQISEDGENWATTQTYRMEDHPEFICDNTTTHAYHFNYNGSRGFQYRAIIQLYAKDSNGMAKMTRVTAPITLGS